MLPSLIPEQDVQDGWNEMKAEFSSYFGAVADPTLRTTTWKGATDLSRFHFGTAANGT